MNALLERGSATEIRPFAAGEPLGSPPDPDDELDELDDLVDPDGDTGRDPDAERDRERDLDLVDEPPETAARELEDAESLTIVTSRSTGGCGCGCGAAFVASTLPFTPASCVCTGAVGGAG